MRATRAFSSSAECQFGVFRGYTYSRRPVKLAWSEHFDRIVDAIAVERQLKDWSGAKKEALVRALVLAPPALIATCLKCISGNSI